jgi:hypothetical protein
MAHNHGAAIPASVRSFSAHLSARRAALVASLACLVLSCKANIGVETSYRRPLTFALTST